MIGQQRSVSIGTVVPANKSSVEVSTVNGSVFYADKPFAVFCGDTLLGWNQMTPQKSIGKHYIVPDIDPYNAFHFETSVRVIATSDHTVVNITGHAVNSYTLDKRGNYMDVTNSDTDTFHITSNYPVSVGLLIEDLASAIVAKTYIILTAVDNFMDFPISLANTNNFVVFVNSLGIGDLLSSKQYTVPQNQTYSLCVFTDYSSGTLRSYPTPSVKFKDLLKVCIGLFFIWKHMLHKQI